MSNGYDVIVVGARCAGSPTAMLLARRGHRVLLLDKAGFPSDTMSTHLMHPPATAALSRWGILDRLASSGCPPITSYSFDFGVLKLAGTPRPAHGTSVAYCPRRHVLDKLLVDAAVEAGAELREEFAVEDLLVSDGVVTGVRGRARDGAKMSVKARFVVGADGRHSLVARSVAAQRYDTRPARCAMYYAYWSGLEVGSFATTIRAERRRGWAAAPTHDGTTVLGVGWPIEEFHQNRRDIEGHYLAAIELDPEFFERLRHAQRESRFVGTAELQGYFRQPFGPGWALVGDAGYHKNPVTAMGISDAFRDAEVIASSLHDVLSGERRFEAAMLDYQRARDETVRPVYEFTDQFARLEPPPLELQQLLGSLHGNQAGIDDFISVQAGTLSAPEFFAPDNVARLAGEAPRAAISVG
jgi:flavin-dependent dehydrogenase